MNVDNTEEFRCLSLCTGYGGIELGLGRAVPSLRTVAYVEIEAFAAANLVAKIEAGLLDAAPVWTDIKTFPSEIFRDRIHIITAGYPCQPFSVAGKRQGTDDARHLWPHIKRVMQTIQPVWCFFENVPGHLTLGFPEVYRSLRDMGYKVEAGLFSAAECGAPHKRERLFILANDTKSRGWRLPVRKRGQKQAQIDIERPGKISPAYEAVADAEHPGPGCGIIEKAQAGRQINKQSNEQSIIRYPARPGQPQYEWEEPRIIISNAFNSGQRKLLQQKFKQRSDTKTNIGSKSEISIEGQSQSRLGRAVDGHSGRVDRLRLLGNGVVPAQAELAFRELIKLF